MQRKINAVCFISILVMAIALIFIELADGAKLPGGDAAAHQYFDHVSVPRFTAAFNEWATRHPGDPDHIKMFDAGDAMRWKDVRAAWRDLDAGAKGLGY
jgi:hypothetical protein